MLDFIVLFHYLPTNWITEGTAANPSMYFQPFSVCEKAPQTQAATNWPKVTTKIFEETKSPLNWGGDASDMYIGTDMDDKPIPIPKNKINQCWYTVNALSKVAL